MTEIEGHCADGFSAVADAFSTNFDERDELGASFSVTVDGEVVVDLWGGHRDLERARLWEKDDLCVIMSSTKGVTALAAHLLATSGELDLDAPVARYWPEFAAAGKDSVLVSHLLSHQAGLPALRQPLPPGAFADWDLMTAALAAEAPFWEPGTAHGYHALTFGFLVGEVIRRVTGRSIGAFVADEIAGPLGIDLFVGTPAPELPRVSGLHAPPMPGEGDAIPAFYVRAMTDPTSLPALILGNTGGYMDPGAWNDPMYLRAEIPAAGGVANARSLALLYGAIVHDRTIGRFTLSNGDLVRMGAVRSASSADRSLGSPGRWTLGFLKAATSTPDVVPATAIKLSEEAFGHQGNGGSYGFCDPACGMSMGYVMNQMHPAMGLTPTGQALADAVYASIGYHRDGDLWVAP